MKLGHFLNIFMVYWISLFYTTNSLDLLMCDKETCTVQCTVYVTYCNTFICHLKKSKDIRFLVNEPGNELSTLKLT